MNPRSIDQLLSALPLHQLSFMVEKAVADHREYHSCIEIYHVLSGYMSALKYADMTLCIILHLLKHYSIRRALSFSGRSGKCFLQFCSVHKLFMSLSNRGHSS